MNKKKFNKVMLIILIVLVLIIVGLLALINGGEDSNTTASSEIQTTESTTNETTTNLNKEIEKQATEIFVSLGYDEDDLYDFKQLDNWAEGEKYNMSIFTLPPDQNDYTIYVKDGKIKTIRENWTTESIYEAE